MRPLLTASRPLFLCSLCCDWQGILYPPQQPRDEGVEAQYRRSHGSYAAGEQVTLPYHHCDVAVALAFLQRNSAAAQGRGGGGAVPP
jgi:hypothetical protein